MRYVGVDLAWGPRNRTGLAVLDDAGSLLDLGEARSDEEVLAWLAPHTDQACVVAFDAPLVVTNPTGRRRCETELAAVFGRYHAGPHPTNTARPDLAGGARALRIAEALGLDVDPRSSSPRRALEVYPHPATIVLFGLPRILRYKHKPGRDLTLLRSEAMRLVDLVEGLEHADPALRLGSNDRWQQVRRTVAAATRKADLKAVEDLVDAVVCAYVGLFAALRPELTTVYGSLEEGYIVTPSPPA
ncbi:MAG TPA: DUF429 domain-containing protein [Nocardioidaceae bacterium]